MFLMSDLKEALKNINKVPNVGIMGMFVMHPNEIGVGMSVLEDVITLVDYCATYGMGHLIMEQKFHLFISSAFSKKLLKQWQTAYQEAPASTTGIRQGIKIYVTFLNLFAAFITSNERKVMKMVEEFLYNVRDFNVTWRGLVELFSLLDHTVMTKSTHCVTSITILSCGQAPRKLTSSLTCSAKRVKHGCSRP